MKAILLAHERSLSLEPFTATRPRALIPVLNVPVLGHNLRQLRAAGVMEVQVIAGHLGDQVKACAAGCSREGFSVQYRQIARDEDLPACLAEILAGAQEPVLLVDAGAYREDGVLEELVRQFAQAPHGILVALAINTNPLYHPRATVDAKRRIVEFKAVTIDQIKINEQSPLPGMPAGCLIMDAKAAVAVGAAIKARNPVTWVGVLAICAGQGLPLAAVPTTRRCITLDYPWEILGASFLGLELTFSGHAPIRTIAPSARVHPDAILKGTIILGEHVVVESGAVLENVILEAGCTVLEHTFIQQAVIGAKSSFGPTGYVKRTVLGPKSHVGYPSEAPWLIGFGKNGFGHHCHGGMGVYGEGVGLNAGAIVTANRGIAVKTKIQGKLMDTGWFNIGAFIGDYARINAQATVMPGRLIGTRAVIGPGVIVYRDVPPYTMIVLKQQLEETTLAPSGITP